MREFRDVRVTEDFDVRGGIRVTQRFQCRQRENEVADGAAADYENPFHLFLL
jgi:hypothetical protein